MNYFESEKWKRNWRNNTPLSILIGVTTYLLLETGHYLSFFIFIFILLLAMIFID